MIGATATWVVPAAWRNHRRRRRRRRVLLSLARGSSEQEINLADS